MIRRTIQNAIERSLSKGKVIIGSQIWDLCRAFVLLDWHGCAREISTEIARRNVAGHITDCGGDLVLANCD